MPSRIDELLLLGETKVDTGKFKQVNSNKSKKTVQIKNLDKDLVFITEGYFDFNEMIWRDHDRPIHSSQWYKNETYHVKFGFQFIQNLYG